jgi:hypothetical protein
VLPRLGITTVRLLGCESATTPVAERTMRGLARILDVRVYGARVRLGNGHYDEHGFDEAFAHLLVEAARLPGATIVW